MDRPFSQPDADRVPAPGARVLPLSPAARETYWRSLAARWSRRVNLCWWLEKWLPLAIAANVVGCLALLLLRERGIALGWGFLGFAALLVVAAILALSVARARFHTPADALLRLDSFLNLRGRLNTAAEGKCPWPEARTLPLPPYRQRAGRTEFAALLSIGLLLAGAFVPLPTVEALPPRAENPSPALEQTLELVRDLRDHDIIEPPQLDALEQQARQLSERPQEDWYRQETLEAAEHLRSQTQEDLQQLAENLSEAASQLDAAASALSAGDPAALQQMGEALAESAQRLQMGKLPASSQTIQQLSQLAQKLSAADQQSLMNALSQMDPQQLKALSERLQQQAGVAQNPAGGTGKGQGLPGPNPHPGRGQGQGPGEGEGESFGSGGIARGPGEAPLQLLNNDPNLTTSDDLSLNNDDLSQAALGDALSTSLALPGEGDPDGFSLDAGGGAATMEGASEAVWRSELTPQENRVLQTYFE
ncbi:MAG: hypothetical protein ACFB20_07705 [Opitutales bacterium]